MQNERELLDFAREINSEVIANAGGDIASGTPGDFKANVFTQMLLDYLCESGAAEGGQVCYFEKSLPAPYYSVRTNGYYLQEDGDRLDFFFSDYSGISDNLRKVTQADVEEAMKQSLRLFALAREGRFDLLEESSEAFDMLQTIKERASSIRRLRVFLLTDKAAQSQRAMQEAIEKGLKKQDRKKNSLVLRMELVDLTRLHRLARRGAERDPVSVDLTEIVPGGLPCIKAPQANDAYECYLAAVPGALLYELYEEHGARVLQLNVRSFLQVKGAVNKGIRETLLSEPSMFLPYNNGIAATAEQVVLGRNGSGTPVILSIYGIQIVNGGQTMASIHRAHKFDRRPIEDVYVQAKISVVTNKRELEFDELVGKISLYSNSQNKVNTADFSANDPLHVELDKLARETWVPGEQSQWFYERARGSYQVMKARLATTPSRKREFEIRWPQSQVFTKTDLAKYLAIWDQLPHVAGKGGQKCFVEYMTLLRERNPKKWKPDTTFLKDLVAKAIVIRRMEKIARDEGFPAYRANVVAYTTALLSERSRRAFNLAGVWSRQATSPELDGVLKDWSHTVFDEIRESAGERNVTEWAKKEACWEHVVSLELELPDGLPEMREGQFTDADDGGAPDSHGPSPEDLYIIAEVMDLQPAAWRLVAEWGSGSGRLTSAQVKLCYVIAQKAEEGWESLPTIGQAKKGVLALRTARKHSSILEMFE